MKKYCTLLAFLAGSWNLAIAQEQPGSGHAIDRTQLTIMVVPHTSHSEDILFKMENDPGYRAAISKINGVLLDMGYRNTIDFKTHMENLDANQAPSPSDSLSKKMEKYIDAAPVDVVVEAEIIWTDPPNDPVNRQVRLMLKAIDKYTSYLYADNATIQSGQREFPSLESAVNTALTIDGIDEFKKFLNQLDASYAKVLQHGRQVNIKFAVDDQFKEGLAARTSTGERLSDKIEECTQKNCFKGQYKVLGVADRYMNFSVQVPVIDEAGNSVSPSQYIRKKIDNYFYNLGFTVNFQERGQWIYFTLKGRNT